MSWLEITIRSFSLQSIRNNRVPLIKFRSAGSGQKPSVGHQGGSSSSGHSSGGAKGLIEDYQLPPRYRRRPIDEQEIEYINRGGPA